MLLLDAISHPDRQSRQYTDGFEAQPIQPRAIDLFVMAITSAGAGYQGVLAARRKAQNEPPAYKSVNSFDPEPTSTAAASGCKDNPLTTSC